jgi:hypothetical protein
VKGGGVHRRHCRGLSLQSKGFAFRRAQPASPERWLADLTLGVVGPRRVVKNDARRFLSTLLEWNSTRVQSDILNRACSREPSPVRSDTETRKLLHEVSRIAERALACAKRVCEEGVPAVEAGLQRLDSFGREKCAPSVRQESRKVEPKVTYEGDPPTSPQS